MGSLVAIHICLAVQASHICSRGSSRAWGFMLPHCGSCCLYSISPQILVGQSKGNKTGKVLFLAYNEQETTFEEKG